MYQPQKIQSSHLKSHKLTEFLHRITLKTQQVRIALQDAMKKPQT